MSEPRRGHVYECDHMRQIVKVDGKWHHITAAGSVGAECGARSIYRVSAVHEGDHTISRWVDDR